MDRRIFRRFYIEVPARVDVLSQGKIQRRFYCRSYNISAGGIFLNTAEPVPVNTDVEIEITLYFENPEERAADEQRMHITTRGKVLRCEHSGLVVRFDQGFEIAVADPESGKMIPLSSSDIPGERNG